MPDAKKARMKLPYGCYCHMIENSIMFTTAPHGWAFTLHDNTRIIFSGGVRWLYYGGLVKLVRRHE